MRSQATTHEEGPVGRRSSALWCLMLLLSLGLIAGIAFQAAGTELALGGIVTGAFAVSVAYTGFLFRSIDPGLTSDRGRRRLVVASPLALLWWLAVTLMMMIGPHVTAWMLLAMTPPVAVACIAADIVRRAFSAPMTTGLTTPLLSSAQPRALKGTGIVLCV